jgi:hypothetical protein
MASKLSSVETRKSVYTRILFYFLIGLFVVLQVLVLSAFAQSEPIYGNMEKLLCNKDIGIEELESKCLLFFEAYDGSPKYGILYEESDFYYKADQIVGKRGYIQRDYYELLKSGRLLYQLQDIDDSYFYVMSNDNGYSSITIINLPPTP